MKIINSDYTTRSMIGEQDYSMKNGKYTNRYENFDVRIFDKEKRLYHTFEKDKKKGMRFTLVYPYRKIFRERKFSRLINKLVKLINPNKKINMELDMMLDEYRLK